MAGVDEGRRLNQPEVVEGRQDADEVLTERCSACQFSPAGGWPADSTSRPGVRAGRKGEADGDEGALDNVEGDVGEVEAVVEADEGQEMQAGVEKVKRPSIRRVRNSQCQSVKTAGALP